VNYLRGDDLLVLNNSRVIRARLRGANVTRGGQIEVLLLRENATNDWWVMLRPGRRARTGTKITFANIHAQARNILGSVVEQNDEGHRRLLFTGTTDIGKELQSFGEVPLPPYIERTARNNLAEDEERYQTIYASVDGSVAAPTAGLHFTDDVLKALRAKGVQVCFVTLHVGPGTFAPVKADILAAHRMHAEDFVIPPDAALRINDAKRNGRRIVAVGTTTVRVLESAARNSASIAGGGGQTCLFIHPPFRFQIVDALLTNFHLPRSTLLMLASAFAAPGETRGRDLILCAYAEAVRARYRFFSYGDAMLII
jgi:S-adenosylmethionine:tRNA ribosyltransferase-isomerase